MYFARLHTHTAGYAIQQPRQMVVKKHAVICYILADRRLHWHWLVSRIQKRQQSDGYIINNWLQRSLFTTLLLNFLSSMTNSTVSFIWPASFIVEDSLVKWLFVQSCDGPTAVARLSASRGYCRARPCRKYFLVKGLITDLRCRIPKSKRGWWRGKQRERRETRKKKTRNDSRRYFCFSVSERYDHCSI